MSGQKAVIPTANDLAASVQVVGARGLPPVEQWNPPFCGDIDMRIARNGMWFYQGSPIQRPELVRLFSSILKREGDRFFLVTPVEKVGIVVEDAPFVAVDFECSGSAMEQRITFTTHVDDTAVADNDHPIRVERDADTGEPAPYVMIRNGLEALIDRKSFYRLVDLAEHRDGWFGLWSGGVFFKMIPSEELEAS
ncbi:MAG: DUF1285 domain-containing protein [Paracoccaceae bacterium]